MRDSLPNYNLIDEIGYQSITDSKYVAYMNFIAIINSANNCFHKLFEYKNTVYLITQTKRMATKKGKLITSLIQ